MATPMLRALRERFRGQASLVGIMRPNVQAVLTGTPWLDRTINFDRRSADPELHSVALVRHLRAAQLDSVVLTTNSLRSALIAYLAGVPQRVGYVRYGRGPLLTERLLPPRVGRRLIPVSAVDYYLGLASAMGCEVRGKTPELRTTASDEIEADRIYRRFGIPADAPCVTLNTGAAYGAAKEWPVEYFAELARRFAAQHDAHVIVICGPCERRSAREIVKLANHRGVHSLADEQVGIGLSKAIVRRADLLVSNDSGPRHFGAAFGIPTVTVFGPTDPRWSHNFHPKSIELQKHMPCGPCARRICPLKHHQCMRDLTIDHVYRAATSLLRSSASKAA